MMMQIIAIIIKAIKKYRHIARGLKKSLDMLLANKTNITIYWIRRNNLPSV